MFQSSTHCEKNKLCSLLEVEKMKSRAQIGCMDAWWATFRCSRSWCTLLQDLLNPRNLSAMAAELYIVFRKILRGLGFFRRGWFIGQMASRGGLRGAGTTPGRGPPSHPQVGPSPGLWVSPGVALLAPVLISSIKNYRKFSSNSENIFRSNFLQQKHDKNREQALGILSIG